MSSNEEPQVEVKASTPKALMIGGIAVGIATFTLVGVLSYGLITTPAPTSIETGIGNPTKINQESIPKIKALQIRHDNPASPTAIIQAQIEPVKEGLYVEWEVTDLSRNTLNKGIFNTDGLLDKKIPLKEGTNDFIFRLRVSNGIETSDWYSENLESIDGSQIPKPSEDDKNSTLYKEPYAAYYQTEWANSEGGVPELKEAVEKAWAIEEVDYYADDCMYLNKQALEPGELVAPSPSDTPSDLVLKYEVLSYESMSSDTDTIQLQYYWCMPPAQI